ALRARATAPLRPLPAADQVRADLDTAHRLRGDAMWTTEHSIEAAGSPEAIWRVWADVPSWGEWNPDIERIELDGPFAAGSTITMTPRGQEPVVLVIAEAAEPSGSSTGPTWDRSSCARFIMRSSSQAIAFA